MTDDKQNFIKRRQIRFNRRSPGPEPATRAVALLSNLDAVAEISQGGPYAIQISYDLRGLSLFEIEETLLELGFSLDNGLRYKMGRIYIRYTEQIERGRFADRPGWGLPEATRRVFMNRYLSHRHLYRTTKPRSWRENR